MKLQQRGRVIVSATILGLGGIRTHLMLLCQLLRRQGIGVEVFATGSNWDAGSRASLEAVGVKFNLPPRIIRQMHKPSALYSRLAWPRLAPREASSIYCIGAGRSHFLMHRLRPHGTLSVNHEIVVPPGPRSLAGQCAERLDATVANSRKVAERMREYWPEKPIRVIPFLTSDRPVPPPARSAVGEQRHLRVVYLGRLVAHKRPDQLVRRWRALCAHPALASAHLDVFGYDSDGNMLEELRAFVSDAKLSQTVRLHGEYELNALPQILAESDLVVLPSLDEGLPLVLVEAMSHGVPFVATAAGGTEELGQDNPDVIVTGTKWEEFEAGLVSMAEKIRAGEIKSRRLHEWVEKRYGYATVSPQWVSCLSNPREFFDFRD
ncbi:MAG TPA: glycosyltransferase family 4 protein [Candidatus Baltobacteraceae bacterium]|jgi:glycosyltransferase involved in cell wall biosynthesis|nr:glycosyltransferase family 4 protein [Candidatus Baltobacteraceae bacterium]